jgi:hypothetical protein
MSGSQQLVLGEGAGGVVANYIEDVFSTWLYSGTGGAQTINNGIDLTGKGGMVWIKSRTLASSHALFDTIRGAQKWIGSNSTSAQQTYPTTLDAFGSTGFTVGGDAWTGSSGNTYASWTFREQPKFFDVVTYTGNGSTQTINHNLGSVPGFIICKSTTSARNWLVYHRSLGATQFLQLDTTIAATTASTAWNNTAPTSTTFTVGSSLAGNENGQTFVAYLFAHDAGGFGLTGTDNVISCGSYTGNGSTDGPVINLGYEPQWLLIKSASGGTIGVGTSSWTIIDSMRGMSVSSAIDPYLLANTSGEENSQGGADFISPTATGFKLTSGVFFANQSGANYIYIAIRRGPMKTPTTGTSVFTPSTVGATNNITVGFPSDTAWFRYRNVDNWRCFDRLRSGFELATNLTDAEGTFNYYPTYIDWDSNSVWNQNLQNSPVVDYFFRRAPGFFDVVCYTGTGSATTQSHNLGVAPELMIVKSRDNSIQPTGWAVYNSTIGATKYLQLNTTGASATSNSFWNNTAPTSTVFTLGTYLGVNSTISGAGILYVAYLFASCPGVSKVGSYTGNGSSQTINCGFTGGARFVLIKRTDSTGAWYVWDSARGIVAGNDPYLLLNSTAAEVATDDSLDTNSTGFIVNQDAATNINVSSASYIFLAIA